MKMTHAIRKSLGDEAADDFEILFNENILTKPEFNERIIKLEALFNDKIAAAREEFVRETGKTNEKIAQSGKTLLLWLLGILIPMWGSLIFLIVRFN